jgi:uncharacterized protein
MYYLIDGHNLIPKVPGLSLSEIDDEEKLILWLQAFSRENRCHVEVFFDRAPAGFSGARKFGSVTAHFIRLGGTADDAIQSRLIHAGKSARNMIVVSSDRQVQAAARAMHARIISSEEFSKSLMDKMAAGTTQNPTEQKMTEKDLAYWESVFQGNNKSS